MTASRPNSLVDINVFLDVLGIRKGWQSSLKVMQMAVNGRINGFVSSITPAIIYFQRRKNASEKDARRDVKDSLKGFHLLELGDDEMASAIDDFRFNDLRILCSFTPLDRCNVIVTRNKRHFRCLS